MADSLETQAHRVGGVVEHRVGAIDLGSQLFGKTVDATLEGGNGRCPGELGLLARRPHALGQCRPETFGGARYDIHLVAKASDHGGDARFHGFGQGGVAFRQGPLLLGQCRRVAFHGFADAKRFGIKSIGHRVEARFERSRRFVDGFTLTSARTRGDLPQPRRSGVELGLHAGDLVRQDAR